MCNMTRKIKKVSVKSKEPENNKQRRIKAVHAISCRKDATQIHEQFDIYYDSFTEAIWFSELNSVFDIEKNNYTIIGKRGKNSKLVEAIIAYDRPDIILIKNNKPLLVIEITQEVPTGHNVGQRFARLARAVELGIPTIYFFPFDAKKHGEYAGLCNLNIRLLAAAKRLYEIHDTPLLCVNWPIDEYGEIITDGSENDTIKAILESYVDSGFDKNCLGFSQQLRAMDNEYQTRLSNRKSYANLPNSIIKSKTEVLLEDYGLTEVPQSFAQRQYSYVYSMEMKPKSCKRQDPYTGMTLLYDYLCCRTGPSVENKESNLVLSFPEIPVETWKTNNPNNPHTKSCNWYLTANLFLFKDGHIWIRG